MQWRRALLHFVGPWYQYVAAVVRRMALAAWLTAFVAARCAECDMHCCSRGRDGVPTQPQGCSRWLWLWQCGGDLHVQNVDGLTPLFCAVQQVRTTTARTVSTRRAAGHCGHCAFCGRC
jgi:hypothetical protein